VRFLSMHTAKALEFPCVAIAGLGLLGRHGEAVEECVRLTYVGVSREGSKPEDPSRSRAVNPPSPPRALRTWSSARG
jgi:superfamily I DNA/RNA helicase